MVNRIRNTRIFGGRTVGIVNIPFIVNSDVFEQCIPTDSSPDIGFFVLTQIDHFCVATPFVVENSVIVPPVFVVTDQVAFWIGGESGFSCSRKPEENGYVSFCSHVSRAVHRSNAFQWQIVVHKRENTFFHFTTVPGTADDLHSLGKIEQRKVFRMQPLFFPFIVGSF
ncbi:hypothetical protein SDC9_99890 [bioreactor metagenome]|uniref:Uncharacterized protein n=1 Tax=bioreactor metagenome TaxID=1076179 RepID=A0A645AIS8_9ZZZZ